MKQVLIAIILLFALVGNVFADEPAPLAPKEKELLRNFITFNANVVRTGEIKIYKIKEEKRSGQIFRNFSGCVPIEYIENGTKKTSLKLFELSVSRVTESNLLTIYNERSYEVSSFYSSCPDRDDLKKFIEQEEKN